MDGDYLTVRQFQNLSYDEKQAYVAAQIAAFSDVSNLEWFFLAVVDLELILYYSQEDDDEDNDEGDEDWDELLQLNHERIGVEDASDVEDEPIVELDQSLFLPTDDEEEDDPGVAVDLPVYVSKDNVSWKQTPPIDRKKMPHNILKITKTGPTAMTKDLNIDKVFKLLMSEEMIYIIVRETNRKGSELLVDFVPFTSTEIYAFIGLLLYAGATRSNRENITDLWQQESHPIYRATMSRNRFSLLLRCIRFDNSSTRAERLKEDKAAPISDLFAMLNANLKACYIAGPGVTVDEQLYGFRGRTKFTQFIPSKPNKYGIKVWWVNCSKTAYPIQGQIYTGLASNGEREVNQGERVVKDLCIDLFSGSGRNITCDNFFTTYSLAQTLKDNKLSILGTVNKRRRFVPKEFLASKDRQVLSTRFGFANDVAMSSYVPKKNKAVVLLSTSHYDTEISDTKSKPQMILDYNKTKGATDTMDKMLSEYSCQRRTNRWPLAFFYNMLDIAALAAVIIFRENNDPQLIRRKLLKELSLNLCMPEIEKRRDNPLTNRIFTTKIAIENILGSRIPHVPATPSSNRGMKRCHPCSVEQIRKSTRTSCTNCDKPVCAAHHMKILVCPDCNFVP